MIEEVGMDISAERCRDLLDLSFTLTPAGRGLSFLRRRYTQPLMILTSFRIARSGVYGHYLR